MSMYTETQVGGIRVPKDTRKECCKKPENKGPMQTDLGSKLDFWRCTYCQCRHFEMVADPGDYGLDLK